VTPNQNSSGQSIVTFNVKSHDSIRGAICSAKIYEGVYQVMQM